MILQGLLLAAAVGWLYWKGYLGPASLWRLALFGGAGVAVFLLARGKPAAAAVVGLLVAGLFFRDRLRGRVARLPADEVAARLLLGVGPRATRAEILLAHRRCIAAVHPDAHPNTRPGAAAGQASDLASEVNAARDLLLARLPPVS